jgi:hypothetical protein
METYFRKMTSLEPYVLAAQWKYTVHLRSDHVPDVLIKMEEADLALKQLAEQFGIREELPASNRSTGVKAQPSDTLVSELRRYYQRDFELFGY